MTVDVDIYDQNDNKVEIDKMPGDPIKVSCFFFQGSKGIRQWPIN